jgi:hypothetical protein
LRKPVADFPKVFSGGFQAIKTRIIFASQTIENKTVILGMLRKNEDLNEDVVNGIRDRTCTG